MEWQIARLGFSPYQCIWNSKSDARMIGSNICMIADVPWWVACTQRHRYRYKTESRNKLCYKIERISFRQILSACIFSSVTPMIHMTTEQKGSVWYTYNIARGKLSTALKNSMNRPGPSNPILVMRRLTDNTDHFWLIKLSAKWPAAANTEAIISESYVKENGLSI